MDNVGRFLTALHELRAAAGRPSTRAIAAATNGLVQHTTVNQLLRGNTPRPRWSTVKAVVEALGGDPSQYDKLWVAAYDPAGCPAPAAHIGQQPSSTIADVLNAVTALTGAVESLTNVVSSIVGTAKRGQHLEPALTVLVKGGPKPRSDDADR